MKAVGAKDRHILAMFLAEAALIGLVGGWLGVLIGWALLGESISLLQALGALAVAAGILLVSTER